MTFRFKAIRGAAKDFAPTIKCEHSASEEGVELNFHDVIGSWWDESTAGDVAALLGKHRGKPVNVSINSLGGYVFDGIGIFNLLVDHDGPVTTTVIGTAASAASIILAAGSKRRMVANTSAMVHRAWGLAVGNAGNLREEAEILDILDQQIAESYAARAGGTAQHWREVMAGPKDKDGTWFSPQAALDAGLIDEIVPVKPADSDAQASAGEAADRRAQVETVSKVKAEAVKRRLRLLDIDAIF